MNIENGSLFRNPLSGRTIPFTPTFASRETLSPRLLWREVWSLVHPSCKAILILCFAGSEDDMEYYVRECGEVLGVTNKLSADARDAKHILEYILAQVAEFKKLNQVCP